MNLQQQIEQQIELGRQITSANPSVNHIILEIDDVPYEDVKNFANANRELIIIYINRIGCQVHSEIGLAVFIKSTPYETKVNN